MKKFNLIDSQHESYTENIIFERTENGFQLLDSNKKPIIIAYNIEETGEFTIFINNVICDNKYIVKNTLNEDAVDNPLVTVSHYKLEEHEQVFTEEHEELEEDDDEYEDDLTSAL